MWSRSLQVEKTTICCHLSYFVVPTFERCIHLDSHSVVVAVCFQLLVCISTFIQLLTVAVVIRNCRLIENKLFLDALSWQMLVTLNIPLWCKWNILQRRWSQNALQWQVHSQKMYKSCYWGITFLKELIGTIKVQICTLYLLLIYTLCIFMLLRFCRLQCFGTGLSNISYQMEKVRLLIHSLPKYIFTV